MERKQHKISPAYTLKIDDEQGIVEAIVSVMGIVDEGNDVVAPGAYAKTISERGRRVKVLDAHSTKSVMSALGTVLAMREVGRNELPSEILIDWPEATGGLWTQTQYLINTPEGLGAFQRIKAGAIDEYSIGYQAIQSGYEKMTWRGQTVNVRVLKEIKLWEYSPVIFGMNPATATTGVKGEKELVNGAAVVRLGDYAEAKMRMACNKIGNQLLAGGNCTADDLAAINMALDMAMRAFTVALPEAVALMAWGGGGMGDYYYDSADDPDGRKAADTDSLAGPPAESSAPTDEAKTHLATLLALIESDIDSLGGHTS